MSKVDLTQAIEINTRNIVFNMSMDGILNGRYELYFAELLEFIEELKEIKEENKKRSYEEYYVVRYGTQFVKEVGKTYAEGELVAYPHLAKNETYEEADRLAQLYGGKVKKVITYIEDVKEYS